MPISLLALLSTFALPTSAPTADPGIAKLQALVKNFPHEELFDDSEVLALARRPKVADWIRKRIAELQHQDGGWPGEERALFDILLAVGPTVEDVKMVSDIARTNPHMLGWYARPLLERAPFSLSSAIEKWLLQPIADGAADLDTFTQDVLWLAAYRFPLAKVRAAMAKAAARFGEDWRWRQNPPTNAAVFEVLLLGPDGKPVESPTWVANLWKEVSENHGYIVWPDGKIRGIGGSFPNHRSLEPALVGYRVAEAIPVDLLRGSFLSRTVTLAPRFRLRGHLTPAPKSPLFARLEELVPFGRPVAPYRMASWTFALPAVPVRSDGTFWVPVHSKGRNLEFFNADGDILLYKPVVPPSEKDLDLGEVPLPTPREFLTVPVFFRWRDGATSKESYDFNLVGKPKAAGKEKEAFLSGGTFSTPLLLGRVRVGTARNVSPGEYALEVTFWKDGKPAEIEAVRMDFTASRPIQPIVIEPHAPKKSAGASPAAGG
jgi:hypothetical protein